jgi:hypothetical protein
MANIIINEALWSSLTDDDQNKITEHLKKNNLLMDGDIITGSAASESIGSWIEDNKREICRIGCDAAAAAAVVSLTITGPGLAVALVAIEAARQACRSSC